MAGGLNKTFRGLSGNNLINWLKGHEITRALSSPVAAQQIPVNGKLDLVYIDKNSTPNVVRLEDYDERGKVKAHGSGAAPVWAHFLPAVNDTNQSIALGIGGHNYFFTDALSGCIIAIYGPNDTSLTVHHINVTSDHVNTTVGHSIGQYNEVYMARTDAYKKVLAPKGVGNDDNYAYTTAPTAKYDGASTLIGKLTDGHWRFYYRSGGKAYEL